MCIYIYMIYRALWERRLDFFFVCWYLAHLQTHLHKAWDNVSSDCYMCVHILLHATIYVSSDCCIYMIIKHELCVLMLPYMCPQTAICVSSYYSICVLVPLCVLIYYICVLILQHKCSLPTIQVDTSSYCYYTGRYYICVLILLLYMCPHPSSYYYYISVLFLLYR